MFNCSTYITFEICIHPMFSIQIKPFLKEVQEKGNERGEKKKKEKLIIYTQITEHLKIRREILKGTSQTTTGKRLHVINAFLLCFIDTHLWNL